ASSDHILACLGLSKQDLVSNPLLTLDFFRLKLNQAHGPDIALLIFGYHQQQQQTLSNPTHMGPDTCRIIESVRTIEAQK
ncbi:hypothetical protein AVEN_54752-1, partial [Araneus ventricosus]